MSRYTSQQLAESYDRIRQRKAALGQENPTGIFGQQDYREGAQNFNELAPKELDTKVLANPFSQQIARTAGQVSTQATAASGVEAQNRFYYEQMLAEQARLEEAKKNRVKPTKQVIRPPKPLNVPTPGTLQSTATPGVTPGVTGMYPITGGTPSTAPGSSYYTQTPSWVNINAGLTTFKAGGHSWTLNASVAPRFKGFINALVATGYKIKTAGSYADRNQANGSGNRSLHSYGLAIDINAFGAGNSYNPGNAGEHYTNMPKNVSALAKKYGLVWGGDWRNSKDYMHFSVPYNGLLRNQASNGGKTPFKPTKGNMGLNNG